MVRSLLVLALLLTSATALAGEKYLRVDGYTTGAVNAGVNFGEYEGAGVVLQGQPGDYPLTLTAVDILCAPYMGAGFGPYLLDIWSEPGAGFPPTASNDDLYSSGVSLTASTNSFNRHTLTAPLTITSGRIFIGVRHQLDSAQTNTTLGLDSSPLVAGANWFFRVSSQWTVIAPAAGGINNNWIIRGVLKVPDVSPTVTGVLPSSGVYTMPTDITVSGDHFELTSTLTVGGTALAISSIQPPGKLLARVPAGLSLGAKDVKVTNLSGLSGTLKNGYTVLGDGIDAGTPAGDAASASDTGSIAAIDSGTSVDSGVASRDGGVDPGAMTLDSISPSIGKSGSETSVVLLGSNFQPTVQVVLGPSILKNLVVKSPSVIEGTVGSGISPGIYDVTAVNPDGKKVTLKDGFTLLAFGASSSEGGAANATGCSCSSSSAGLSLYAAFTVLLGALRRRTPR